VGELVPPNSRRSDMRLACATGDTCLVAQSRQWEFETVNITFRLPESAIGNWQLAIGNRKSKI